MKISPRSLVLVLAVLGLSVGALATLRLAAVVLATPTTLWLQSYPRLLDGGRQDDAGWRSRAKSLTPLLNDPALMRARLEICVPESETDAARAAESGSCLLEIDNALRLTPTAADLWLVKAHLLLAGGEFGEPVFDALRVSYRVAPREGWIAAGRVVIGLRIFPLLPADLQDRVKHDLAIVLTYPTLSAPLVEAYTSDLTLRRAAAPALVDLPDQQFAAFAEIVRDRIE